MTDTVSARYVAGPTDCGQCGYTFEPGDMRYRSDDGSDYCSAGCGQRKWAEEHPASRVVTDPRPDCTNDVPVDGQPLAGGTLAYKRRASAERQRAYWQEFVTKETDHGFTIAIEPVGGAYLLVWKAPS